MKAIICSLLFLLLLSSCEADPGMDNGGMKTFLLVVVIVIGFAVVGGMTKNKEAEQQKQSGNAAYLAEWNEAFGKCEIAALNKIVSPPNFGLAISDDLQKLIVFNAGKSLHIYDHNVIINSEYRFTYNEYVNSKTKVPVVSMLPQANTKGQIVKTFAFAELLVSLKDLQNPVLKFRFYKQDEAEKFDALIKMMINK